MKQIKSSIAKAGLATALIILLPSVSIASDHRGDRDDDYKSVRMSDRDDMNERHHERDRAKKKRSRSHRHGNHDNNQFGHDTDHNDDHRK